MWSQLLLCCLVGLVAASDNGWQSGKEYTYKVQGRTLTALHEVAEQYSGIFMRADFIVRPKSGNQLIARIANAEYAQVHTVLPEGWNSEVSASQVHYESLKLSEKPFEVQLNNGVVESLTIGKDVTTWECNIIKSFVSQFQLDTLGQNAEKSPLNQLPNRESNSGAFKTMEDTITGNYETIYDIAPLPEYVLLSQPWLAPLPELRGSGDFIEVVKNKNFSQAEERLGYYHGFGDMGNHEPNTNQMGSFFLRNSVSRAVLSGSLEKYTIQSASTTNKIIVSPTLNTEQKGMVVSHLNATLCDVKSASGHFEIPSQTQTLKSLTYTFNTPFSTNQRQGENQENREQERKYSGSRRFAARMESQESESVESSEEWAQGTPSLSEPPQSPLLPMYIGYKGQSVKNSGQIQVVEVCEQLANEISREIQKPERIPKEQTLTKYVLLSSIARIMSEKELEQVTQALYTDKTQGTKATTWFIFRDVLAECGTGPALLVIKNLILSKKIQHEEAAEVIATLADSVRQPTEEYMRAFYQLAAKEQHVTSQGLLNDTAILSFADLVCKVYVNKQVSHQQFPVHSFGKFNNKKGQEWVMQEVIPYLKEQLQRYIRDGDSHNTLVYIRALGNVAHPKILAAFEPYLEGEKQASNFQRLQMVVALDKFAKIYPKISREVCYRIYSNQGERQEIRVAAVYQIMRSSPTAATLQRMAEYTHVDTDEQVNAAVQSAIEFASELEGAQFAEVSANAQAAKPLLAQQSYGMQYSRNYLSSYVQNEMNMYYTQNVHSYGSSDSWFPNGIKYSLRSGLGDMKRRIFAGYAMVSSIDELTNVFERQTQNYQNQQEQQQEHHNEAQQNQWSSESLAKLFGLENQEREQLEGSFLFQLKGISRFFAINNRTIELLPSVISDIEECLREGKDVQYTKILNRFELTLSFPTEMAVPFLYTLDAPTLLHMQGHVSATAEPKISNGEFIKKPNALKAQAEITALVSAKISAKLGFVTPFDHHQYISGYDKNVQVYMPLKSSIEIDVENKHMTASISAIEPEKNAKVFHYSTWPYTAVHNILHMTPTNNKLVNRAEPETKLNAVFGKQSGVAFKVQYVSEQKFFDARWLYEQLNRQSGLTALFAPIYDETMQQCECNIEYLADQSHSRKVDIRVAFDEERNKETQGSKPEIQHFAHLPREQKQRVEKMMKLAAATMNNAHARTCDIAIQFQGENQQNKVEYTASAAWSVSSVADKARFLFCGQKHAGQSRDMKPYHVAFIAESSMPNTNELDFSYALKQDTTADVKADFAFGDELSSATKIQLKAKFNKSENRKQYLKSHPIAEECYEQMRQGNNQLPACAQMTAVAGLMDRCQLEIQFNNVNNYVRNATEKLYNAASYLGYYNLDENVISAHGSNKDNQVNFNIRFEPDFESVNVTMQSHKMVSNFDNIRLNQLAKQVFGVHPDVSICDRVMSEVLDYDTYKPMCVVDQRYANTFDNKTYPIDLSNSWTVMFQYAPRFARAGNHQQRYLQQQKNLQTEQYAVLVKSAATSKAEKECKITFRNAQTEGKLIEIDLKPTQGHCGDNKPCAEIKINGKQIQYNAKTSSDFQNGAIKIYAIPNGEAKIYINRAFTIIYDGKRVKMTTGNDKFRQAVRGLCGTFTGEESDDFLTPKNCVVADPFEFASAYTVGEQRSARGHKSACVAPKINFVNVITKYDVSAGQSHNANSVRRVNHSNNQQHFNNQQHSCSAQQTRYVIDETSDRICFTTRPVPVCKSSCATAKAVNKSVPVHCVERNSVAEQWRKQIKQGASPDFSGKSTTKYVTIEVAEHCSQY